MAELTKVGRTCVINAAGTVTLGDVSDKLVSAFTIHLVSSSFSGTVIVKGRSREPDASTDSAAYVPIVYHQNYLNGANGDGTLVTTTITDTSIITVPASGMSVQLTATRISGSIKAYWTPVTA